MEAVKAFEQVAKRAEEIRNDEHQYAGEMSPGDAWAQGDVAFVCLSSLPKGATLDPGAPLQLVAGTTQGSRHILAEAVPQYRLTNPSQLEGTVLDARETGCTVTHPQHGDVTLRPGIYQVRYERAYAEELKRVLD